MFYLTTIDLSPHVYPDLVTELLKRWPECEGRRLAGEPKFFFQGKDEDVKLKAIIEVINSMGYGLGSDNYKFKPAKRIPLERWLTIEDSDYEKALLIQGYPEKTHNDIEAFVHDGRLKVSKPPPKFKFCFSVGHFLITGSIKKKLEEEEFRGMEFLPVDHVFGDWAKLGLPETYSEIMTQIQLENLYCLSAKEMLPEPDRSIKACYRIDQLSHLKHLDVFSEFRITEGRLRHRFDRHFLIFSNRFYTFWKKNFGEINWSIIELQE